MEKGGLPPLSPKGAEGCLEVFFGRLDALEKNF